MNKLSRTLKKASKGNRQSQLELYESFYGYAISVALRFSDSREDAQEIVHDSFIKAFAKLSGVEDTDSFKPWFRRIIVNTSIDRFRKKETELHHLDVVEHDTPDLSEDVLGKLSAETIYELIGDLPKSYRMVFTLYAVEGFKHEEIAQKLGISAGTSKSNLAKARQKLQAAIISLEPRWANHG